MLPPDNNVRVPRRDGDYRADSSEEAKKVRPPPNASKDFRKIMRDEDKTSDDVKKPKKKHPISIESSLGDEDEEYVAVGDEDPRPSAISFFASRQTKDGGTKDLSKEQEGVAESKGAFSRRSKLGSATDQEGENPSPMFAKTAAAKAPPAQQPKESPFAIYKQMSKESAWDAAESEVAAPTKGSKSSRLEKTTTRYSQEQADLASVNPLGGPINAVRGVGDGSGSEAQSTSLIAKLKEIADQITKEIQVLERAGQTDTIIDLHRPNDLFDNVRVVVTSFDSAAKEFNLSFENLTAQAKQLLDQNMSSLRATLEDKGYARAIHIVTTTTMIEHRIPGEIASGGTGDRERREERERNREQEEEETG